MIYANLRTLQQCALLSLIVLLVGCSNIVHKSLSASSIGAHKIAIFFDGTHNDIASDTNIKRLHSLVSLQDKPNISSIYIEGVGTEYDVLGMMTGTGMAARVQIGYEFILNNYRSGDEVYIFGFSRGAYAARILTSILYNAGIVTTTNSGMSNSEVAKVVFRTVKCPHLEQDDTLQQDSFTCPNPETNRKNREEIRLILEKKALMVSPPVDVEVLGLWDTVEAMGAPNWISKLLHQAGLKQHVVNIDGENRRYGDQLCNVKRAYQALSIDDDREWIFTPLPLSRTYLFDGCAHDCEHLLDKNGEIVSGRLREVWFSGAHSDVGGGYDDSLLSGVSLNWMIENLKGRDGTKDTGLLPVNAKVPEDQFGSTHDPEAGWGWGMLYHEINRDIATYITSEKQRREFRGKVCVHPSVLERRRALHWKENENGSLSLMKEGVVHLIPEKSNHDSWVPRLHEADNGEMELVLQVWPNCTGMESLEKRP